MGNSIISHKKSRRAEFDEGCWPGDYMKEKGVRLINGEEDDEAVPMHDRKK